MCWRTASGAISAGARQQDAARHDQRESEKMRRRERAKVPHWIDPTLESPFRSDRLGVSWQSDAQRVFDLDALSGIQCRHARRDDAASREDGRQHACPAAGAEFAAEHDEHVEGSS